jgi:hypothetical protein
MKKLFTFITLLALISLSSAFAQNYDPIVYSQGISKTFINVRGNPVAVGQLTINAPVSGKVLVHFNGDCIPSSGDEIVLAASDQVDWGVNDGNVSVQNNEGCFSHIRVYSVAKGSHTYYAVAQNYVHTSGTGIASIYGSLTAEFFPNEINTAVKQLDENSLLIYPNPTQDKLFIEFPEYHNAKAIFMNSEGQLLQSFDLQNSKTQIDISNVAKGIYILKIATVKGFIVKKVIKQ